MKDQTPKQREIDRIRDLLDAAAPNNPDTTGRADAVSRRGRRSRTRRGVLSGIAVAAVAATVIVGPHLIRSSPTSNEATDPSNPATSVAPAAGDLLANPCPAEPIDVNDAQTQVRLPSDVVSVRLCRAVAPGGQGSRDVESTWTAPVDGLVSDIPGFVESINTNSPIFDPASCASSDFAPDPFAFQFTASDGSVTTVGSSYSACDGYSLAYDKAAATEVSGQTLLAHFSRALNAQRRALEPPTLDMVVACDAMQGAPAFIDPGTDLALTQAVLCRSADAGESTADVPVDALDQINHDFASNATHQDPGNTCYDPSTTTVLYGINAWGDPIQLADTSCNDTWLFPDKDGAVTYWVPAPATTALIDGLLG